MHAQTCSYVFVNVRERESSTEQQSRAGIACGNSEVSGADCLVPADIRIPLFRLLSRLLVRFFFFFFSTIPHLPSSFFPLSSSRFFQPVSPRVLLLSSTFMPGVSPSLCTVFPSSPFLFFSLLHLFPSPLVACELGGQTKAAKFALLRNLICWCIIAAIVVLAACTKGDVFEHI